MGHLSCSRKGFGEDNRLTAVYSPKQADCLEIGFQVPSCLDGGLKRGGYVNPSSQSLDDNDVELDSLVSGNVESLVGGPCGFGKGLSVVNSVPKGFLSKVFDDVEVGSDSLFPVEIHSTPKSIPYPLVS